MYIKLDIHLHIDLDTNKITVFTIRGK